MKISERIRQREKKAAQLRNDRWADEFMAQLTRESQEERERASKTRFGRFTKWLAQKLF